MDFKCFSVTFSLTGWEKWRAIMFLKNKILENKRVFKSEIPNLTQNVELTGWRNKLISDKHYGYKMFNRKDSLYQYQYMV